MKMKLYYATGTCSLSVHIALREAGLPFDLERVDLRSHKLGDGGDFYAINSRGYVPVLELGNAERLTEGPAIVQYIADLAPDAGLAPRNGTFERVRLQEWLNFITAELHKGFTPLFVPSASEEWREAARQKLAQRFDWLDPQLRGKSWLMGGQFTVADGYLFTVLSWTKPTGIDLSKWPVLQEYANRVAVRPRVQEALKAEGLIQNRAA